MARKKKIPRTKYPISAERTYAKILLKMVSEMSEITLYEFDKHIAPVIENEMHKDSLINDGIRDFIQKIIDKIKALSLGIFNLLSRKTAALRFVNIINSASKANIDRQMKVQGLDPTRSEPWLKKFMNEQVEKNVGFITNIRDDYTEKIEQIIIGGIKTGVSSRVIEKELVKQIGMTENRARFVARDQTGSIFGQMTAKRHQEAKIAGFRWSDSGDGSVRPKHKELNDKVFSYDNPPDEGFPGEPYNCRCVADPVFDVKEIEEQNSQDEPHLSEEEQEALNRYISSESYKINEKLRGDLPLDENDKKFINNLNKALDKLPRYKGDVTRSLYFSNNDELNKFLSTHVEDAIITYKAYTSTTTGQPYNPEGQVQIYIFDSTKGKDIRSFNESEAEVLYKRNTEFHVIDKEEINGVYHILLKEL